MLLGAASYSLNSLECKHMIQVVGVMHAKKVTVQWSRMCMHACIQRSNGLSITSHSSINHPSLFIYHTYENIYIHICVCFVSIWKYTSFLTSNIIPSCSCQNGNWHLYLAKQMKNMDIGLYILYIILYIYIGLSDSKVLHAW